MGSNQLELLLLVYKALENTAHKDIAASLRERLEQEANVSRVDIHGNYHKANLDHLLAQHPNLNSSTLEKVCKLLKNLQDQDTPPSRVIDSFLADGENSLLRTPLSLKRDAIKQRELALISHRHSGLSYRCDSINLFHHVKAQRYRTQHYARQAVPTDFYSKYQLHVRLMGHLSAVYCVCFDQTGQYIITGADDHLIKVWSATTGRLFDTLRGHAGEITDLSVNYENRLLASGGNDRIIRIWDLKTSKLLECFMAHAAVITSVKFAPYNRHGNDRYLVSTSKDGCIILWAYNIDTLKFQKIKRFQERNRRGAQIACSAFSVGGSFLACGSTDNFIHVYGFHPDIGPYWIAELNQHNDNVDSIQFCNNGYRFVTGSPDGTAIIWAFKEGDWQPLKLNMNVQLDHTVLPRDENNIPKVYIVQWSRDDRYVMTSIVDHSIKVWDSRTGELVHVLKGHSKEVYLIEAHPTDPRIFVSASHDGTMAIWDIEQGRLIKKFKNDAEDEHQHVASYFDMKFSPDGSIIALTDSHGYLSLYGIGGAEKYKDLPAEMFFHTDYRPLIRDMRSFVIDEQSHLAPHQMPRPNLVDMNGNPYPESFQRLVPDWKGRERIIIPPLKGALLAGISEHIASHSRMEDEEYLAAKSRENVQRCEMINDDSSTEIEDSDDETIIDSDATEYEEVSTRKRYYTRSRRKPRQRSSTTRRYGLRDRKRFRRSS